MLDEEQINAPQFANDLQETAPAERRVSPMHPLAMTMAPLLFGANMMTVMREARESSSILQGIQRRRTSRT